jgi:uncharacterized membrane protein YedE/YeeE
LDFTTKPNKGQIYGGLIFGLGWAVTDLSWTVVCKTGTGATVMIVTLFFAIVELGFMDI